MTEIIEQSEDGRYRVRLRPDSDAVNPRKDYDHLSHVVTVPNSRYNDVDDDYGPFADEWAVLVHRRDDAPEVFARWVRIFHGAVAEIHTPLEGPVSVWYLLPNQFHEVADPKAYLDAEIKEYQDWADGNVYGWVIDEKAHWSRLNGEHDEIRTTWEEEDSCWGLIGYEYAEEEAKRAFADFLKDH